MPDQDLRSRDRELTEIAKSIAQLAELFKDLSVMVIDQGTLLDSVEYNIEQTAVQMSDAVKELNMATQCVHLAFASYHIGSSLTHLSTPYQINQISEKHWKTKVYLPPPPDHLWSHSGTHLQTSTTSHSFCITLAPVV